MQNGGTSAKLLVTRLCVRCASICKSNVLQGSETCGHGLRFWYLRIWSGTVQSKLWQRSGLVPRQGWRLSRSEGQCYAPCSSDTDAGRPTRLRSDSVGPPSVTLRTLGTALHNLSRDTGDLFTSLSFLLYLLIFPMPRSDYLPRIFLMFLLIYFRSSSGSSINSSAIVGST